jgi:hypothetical protein
MTRLLFAPLLFATIAGAHEPLNISGGAYLIDVSWHAVCPPEVLRTRDYSGECWTHVLVPHHIEHSCVEAPEPSEPTDCEQADLNGDGEVNMKDSIIMSQGMLNLTTYTLLRKFWGVVCSEVDTDG